MQDSRLSLHTWTVRLSLMSRTPTGLSSRQMQSTLGIAQSNAWYLGQRIRTARHGLFGASGPNFFIFFHFSFIFFPILPLFPGGSSTTAGIIDGETNISPRIGKRREKTMSNADRLLRREEVERRCQISRSTIYKLMRVGAFPEPLRIGSRAVRWSQREIEGWIASRPRATGDRPGPGASGVY